MTAFKVPELIKLGIWRRACLKSYFKLLKWVVIMSKRNSTDTLTQ